MSDYSQTSLMDCTKEHSAGIQQACVRDGQKLRGKTELMQMSRWKQEHDVYIEGDEIYQIDLYKNLGVEIDERNNQVTEINAKIGKYRKAF